MDGVGTAGGVGSSAGRRCGERRTNRKGTASFSGSLEGTCFGWQARAACDLRQGGRVLRVAGIEMLRQPVVRRNQERFLRAAVI